MKLCTFRYSNVITVHILKPLKLFKVEKNPTSLSSTSVDSIEKILQLFVLFKFSKSSISYRKDWSFKFRPPQNLQSFHTFDANQMIFFRTDYIFFFVWRKGKLLQGFLLHISFRSFELCFLRNFILNMIVLLNCCTHIRWSLKFC